MAPGFIWTWRLHTHTFFPVVCVFICMYTLFHDDGSFRKCKQFVDIPKYQSMYVGCKYNKESYKITCTTCSYIYNIDVKLHLMNLAGFFGELGVCRSPLTMYQYQFGNTHLHTRVLLLQFRRKKERLISVWLIPKYECAPVTTISMGVRVSFYLQNLASFEAEQQQCLRFFVFLNFVLSFHFVCEMCSILSFFWRAWKSN